MNGRVVGAYLDAKLAIGRDHIARGHIRSADDVEGAVNRDSVQSVPERLGARGVQPNQVALNHTIVHAIGYEHANAAARRDDVARWRARRGSGAADLCRPAREEDS